MEQNTSLVLENCNNEAILQILYENTEDEIFDAITKMNEQELLSFFTYLQELEDIRNRRINQLAFSRMNLLQKAISNFTFGILNQIPAEFNKYEKRCMELRRIQSIMQNSVNNILAIDSMMFMPLFHRGIGIF